MSTAYYDRKTAIGLVLGTGTNASYIESIKNIDTLENFEGNAKEVNRSIVKHLIFRTTNYVLFHLWIDGCEYRVGRFWRKRKH